MTLAAQLERRRREAARRWGLGQEIVLVGAGEPIPVPGRGDLTYPFKAHSEYFYLTDRNRPGGILAFDPAEGWIDFVRRATREEQVWTAAEDDDSGGVSLEEFEEWLSRRQRRPIACLGSHLSDVASDAEIEADVRYELNAIRRRKDPVELSRMRAAERATRAGFALLPSWLGTGKTERGIQIELEAAFFRAGGDDVAYGTIVGSGPNSAVLHFEPTGRQLNAGELVLVDAGAECQGYACDVTRTYAVSGQFSSEQAEFYQLVLSVQRATIERCQRGAEWRDIHEAACADTARGLLDIGLLKGSLEEILELRTQALFFPHGVGHMVGLGVRDAGEILRGRETRNESTVPRVRVDLPLEPGHVFTVEPGVYFIPPLLNGELGSSRPHARFRRDPDRGQRSHHRGRPRGPDLRHPQGSVTAAGYGGGDSAGPAISMNDHVDFNFELFELSHFELGGFSDRPVIRRHHQEVGRLPFSLQPLLGESPVRSHRDWWARNG
jgi:Xaa-Pro aminopeptidase